MFSGISTISVDAKGRVAVPVSLRERLEEAGVSKMKLTVDPDKCLLIYPIENWRQFEERLMALSNLDPINRGLQRTYVGHASDIDLDSNGRFLIPPRLRKFASIEKKAVILGQGHKLELWSEERWDEKFEEYPDLLSGISLESLSAAAQELSI